MKNLFLTDELSQVNGEDTSSAIIPARWLLLVVTLLVVFGLTMLYSASYNTAGLKYFRNQLIWVALGSAGAFAAFVVGYRRIAAGRYWWMGICFVLLLAAVLFFPAINGANRWIRIRLPGLELSLQPSEFAKIAVALFVAKYCSDNLRTFALLRSRNGLLPLALGAGLLIGGILIGRDFGTTLLVLSVTCLTLFIAGLNLRYFVIPAVIVALLGVYIVLHDPTRLARITSFTRPELVQQDEGYQLWNSLLALGSGGWTGIGFMESRMKAKYLPEAHTDFILAIVGEELGLIWMLILIVLYGWFTVCALKISLQSPSRLGMLLGFALTMGITLQAAINIAVVSGSAPTKGMPAPFISYGGSNLMASLIAVGLLVSIAAETAYPGYNEEYLNAIRRTFSFLPWWRGYRNREEE